ncbi:putative CAP domain-containing protein [Helianthus anomalus]
MGLCWCLYGYTLLIYLFLHNVSYEISGPGRLSSPPTFRAGHAEGSGTFTSTATVNLWVAEKSYYDYTTNTCASGHVCGHYTQVVWRNLVQLGCARVQCTNNDWWFVICSYYPRGNYIGQSP